MNAISPQMRRAASLSALLLVAGFPEWSLAGRSRVGNVHDMSVYNRTPGGGERLVYRLSGQSLGRTRGG
jgi:hypothetical protein